MSNEPAPTIDQQIREVEAVYLSREAWLRQRKTAISSKRPVPPDTGCVASSLPTLKAALRTLMWVRDNRERLRSIAADQPVNMGDVGPVSGRSGHTAGKVFETLEPGR